MQKLRGGLVVLGLAMLAVLSGPLAQAQKTKGKVRPAETRFLMRGVVQSNCASLAKLLKEGPGDDKAWETALCHAEILNEMSYVMMDDGRCPDGAWAGAAKTLRENSAKVIAAARGKNADEARAAFKGLTSACATCHKAHKQ